MKSMEQRLAIPVEEYLSTSFEDADKEYVDGEVVERNVGGKPHSRIQGRLVRIFGAISPPYNTEAFPELRLRLGPRLYRIPDVCLFQGPQSEEQFPSQPPLVAVEILSPDDKYSEVLRKLEEYSRFGVRHIWLLDPARQSFAVYESSTLSEAAELSLPECNLTVGKADLY